MDRKNNINCAVFDLDGTLIKSHTNIYKATTKTFEDLEIDYNMPEEEFEKHIGHHFVDIFESFDIDVPDFEHFINVYKENYFKFINTSEFYHGVEDTIKHLSEKNIKIALLTTKGQDQAERILEHFEIDKYFDEIMGRRPGIEHKPSAEPLQIICKTLNANVNETIMIGDSELDIGCGKNAGAKTCAVTYGYRTTEQLEKENPDFIIDDLSEIKNIIFS